MPMLMPASPPIGARITGKPRLPTSKYRFSRCCVLRRGSNSAWPGRCTLRYFSRMSPSGLTRIEVLNRRLRVRMSVSDFGIAEMEADTDSARPRTAARSRSRAWRSRTSDPPRRCPVIVAREECGQRQFGKHDQLDAASMRAFHQANHALHRDRARLRQLDRPKLRGGDGDGSVHSTTSSFGGHFMAPAAIRQSACRCAMLRLPPGGMTFASKIFLFCSPTNYPDLLFCTRREYRARNIVFIIFSLVFYSAAKPLSTY